MSETATLRTATSARHARLMALVQGGVGLVEDLAVELDVSPSTVRRDLAQLTAQGRLARTYGGAISRGSFRERSVVDSAGIRYQAKVSIAAAAASFIQDDSTIFLDAGTTCVALAEQLHHLKHLTVMTRGLEVGSSLASSDSITVMMLGGTVRKLSHGLVGPLTDLALDRMTFDLAFLGADAVHATRGIGEPTIDETIVKERVSRVSTRVFVLADSTKISGSRPPAWTNLEPGWSLITDSDVSPDLVRRFEDSGVDVIVAQQ